MNKKLYVIKCVICGFKSIINSEKPFKTKITSCKPCTTRTLKIDVSNTIISKLKPIRTQHTKIGIIKRTLKALKIKWC
jgi:hypothetical protein